MSRSGARGMRQLLNCLLVVSALSLVGMPVSYRGGAKESHPHAFLQLWLDAAHGSFNHHNQQEVNDQSTPITSSDREHVRPNQAPVIADGADDDGPRITAMTVLEGRTLVLIAGTWLILCFGAAGRRLFAQGSMLNGRSPRPEFPPPRPSSAFA